MKATEQSTSASRAGLDVRTRLEAEGVILTEEAGGSVKVAQASAPRGRLFSARELVRMARELYPSRAHKIVANTLAFDPSAVTPEWLREQMARYELKPRDLMSHLSLRPTTVSVAINGSGEVASSTKALFYYYFLAQNLSSKDLQLKGTELAEVFDEALRLVRERQNRE